MADCWHNSKCKQHEEHAYKNAPRDAREQRTVHRATYNTTASNTNLAAGGTPLAKIVHDKGDNNVTIFSRDCPEYCIETPAGEEIWILPNHFKSKFGGNDSSSQDKRRAQAQRTADIYQALLDAGHDKVVVLGDLNDTPDSNPLQPLLNDTDLKDVSDHPVFDTGEFAGRGTFGLGNDNNKIDYLLLSPVLFDRITACGLFRKGAWPGVSPKRWTTFKQLEKPIHAASDHHLIWCEIQ